jgi:hypothetical protein
VINFSSLPLGRLLTDRHHQYQTKMKLSRRRALISMLHAPASL